MIKLLVLLIIAALCGSIGAKLAGSSKKGCLTNIVLGFIGALLGRWISEKLDMDPMLTLAGIPVIWSVIGAALFVAVLNMLSGGRKD